LILKKISKIVAIRCQILSLKCTKIDFGWAPPQTPLGQLTALPRPLAVFKGPTSKGKEGKGKIGGEGKENGRGWRRGEGERPYTPPVANSWLRQ